MPVLLDREDNVTEGRGWNIFVLRDGVLMSPDRGVLEGITRKTVLELAAKMNIDCRLTKVPVDDMRKADEVFISSTAGGIMPVRSIDKVAVGDGAPGPVTMRLREMYWKLHEDPAYSTSVRYGVSPGRINRQSRRAKPCCNDRHAFGEARAVAMPRAIRKLIGHRRAREVFDIVDQLIGGRRSFRRIAVSDGTDDIDVVPRRHCEIAGLAMVQIVEAT